MRNIFLKYRRFSKVVEFDAIRREKLSEKFQVDPNRLILNFSELNNFQKSRIQPVSLVPTMGGIHGAHLGMVSQARKELNDTGVVMASVFVNPAQFAPGEDYDRYPRQEEEDIKKLLEHGVDYIFIPSRYEMYPSSKSNEVLSPNVTHTYIVPNDVDTSNSEGMRRPGFFTGVLTVVAKLFNLIKPEKAYFGQKDGVQLMLVSRMVEELNFDVEIVPVSTIREEDGLAMSSRNVYLTEEERKRAPSVFRSLNFMTNGLYEEKVFEDVRKEGVRVLEDLGFIVEYISLNCIQTGSDVNWVDIREKSEKKRYMLSIAVNFGPGRPRLIDNVLI
eukprot:snap_masked-scaffold_42-processed-gene-2.33-mRNA-1 protein AED:0.04 eAED:0.04 QI:0/-1/0/1/-1/1/1/0/330